MTSDDGYCNPCRSLVRLEARLKLAEQLSSALTSFRNVAGSAGMRDSFTGRDVLAAHDVYLAGEADDTVVPEGGG